MTEVTTQSGNKGNSGPQSPKRGASRSSSEESANLHGADHWARLAEEPGNDGEADSTAGDDVESSTASIASSILRYRTIHGRTYHSERGRAEYWGTNDTQQMEALDIIHYFLLLAMDEKLYRAPLSENIQSILDVGTGTGIWAIAMADDFPSAEVIGTDISPIQPTWVPPNVKFEIEDCTEEWTFAESSFDYVHMRYLYGSISDWSALFKQAFRACKPGGWVESFECSPMMESDDGTVTSTSAINEWGKFFIEGGKKLGRPFTIIEEDLQKNGMEKAGFVDIQTWDFKAPIGAWPRDPKLKNMGVLSQAAMEQDYEGFVLYMANMVLGWSIDEVRVYCSQLRREMRSGKFHPYCRLRVVYGRKPSE